MTIADLNRLSTDEARAELERLCGAPRWIESMLKSRPFADRAALEAAVERAFEGFDRRDWLEAFAHHPKIGDVESLRARFAATSKWAGEEQGGTAAASDATLAELSEANRAYEERFGYIFVVCATGRSADEMLAELRARMGNDPDWELATAAEEQMKITRLRLGKLLDAPA